MTIDGVIVYASAAQQACCVAGFAPSVEQGSGNFLEFKCANYPEKQSGISWQEI